MAFTISSATSKRATAAGDVHQTRTEIGMLELRVGDAIRQEPLEIEHLEAEG